MSEGCFRLGNSSQVFFLGIIAFLGIQYGHSPGVAVMALMYSLVPVGSEVVDYYLIRKAEVGS
jgi:hypothetical protein